MSQPTYDFQKIFFRRPLLTEENIRLWSCMLVFGLIAIGIILYGVTHIEPIPITYADVREAYDARVIIVAEQEPSYEAHLVEIEDHLAAASPDSILLGTNGHSSEELTEPSPTIITASAVDNNESHSHLLFNIDAAESSNRTADAVSRIVPGLSPQEQSSRTTREIPTTQRRQINPQMVETSAVKRVAPAISGSSVTDFEVVGGVQDTEQTIAITYANRRMIQRCISMVTRNDPTIRGQVVIKFDLHAEGHVIPTSIRFTESDISDSRVLSCIRRTIRRWNFPPLASSEGVYTLTQKYVF